MQICLNSFKQVDHQENPPCWLLVIWQYEDLVGGEEPPSEASLHTKYGNVSDIGGHKSKILLWSRVWSLVAVFPI